MFRMPFLLDAPIGVGIGIEVEDDPALLIAIGSLIGITNSSNVPGTGVVTTIARRRRRYKARRRRRTLPHICGLWRSAGGGESKDGNDR